MYKLLGRGIMKRILITLVLFEIILISYINLFVYPKVEKGNKAFAESSLNKLILEKQISLEYLFDQVEYETENLGLWLSDKIDDKISEEDMQQFYTDYFINRNSILTNKFISEHKEKYISNIHYSYNKDITQKEISDIINTEKLELQFEKCFERIPSAEWVYIITKDNMIRMYPAFSDNVSKFDYGHNFKEDVYYYMADETNNPDRKPIWTNPYVDFLGKGLMITCSYPVYKNNEMIGVACIDIGLTDIRNSISDLAIVGTGISFLIDEEGKIIYYPGYSMKDKGQGAIVNDSIATYASSQKEKDIFDEMILERKGYKTYYDNGKEKFLLYNSINGLNWIIGFQVDRKAYYEENILVNDNFLSLVAFSVFLIIILLVYYYRSLSRPILRLIDDIHEMGSQYLDDIDINYDDDNEIKILNGTFNNLRCKLDEYFDILYYKNNELQTIFNNMPGLLYIIDQDYNLKMFNNECEKIIFHNVNSLNNKKCFNLLFDRNDVCCDCPINSDKFLDNSGCCTEIHYKDKIYNVSSFPIYNSDNTIRELIIFSVDKTEEVIRNLELANAEKFSIIGQVSASVTHHLKNNISVIKGACYLLNEIEKEKEFDIQEVREVLDELNSGIKDAENTIYSLIEFDKNGDNTSRINILSVIEQMLVIEKNSLYKHKIEVIKQFDSNEIYLYSTRNSLKFIFSNLIRNAIESMNSDGGTLTFRAFENKCFVHIEIMDTGNGIDEDMKKNIFDPFFTTKDNGSGLGLWIVKEQVKKLKGHIYCESKKDKGAKFIVVLPIKATGEE